jgi:hypothetical protein
MSDKNTLQLPDGWVKEGASFPVSSEKPSKEAFGEDWVFENPKPERDPAADAATGAAIGVASKLANPLVGATINKVADIASGPMPAGAKQSVYRHTPSSGIMNWVRQMHNVSDYSPAYDAQEYGEAHRRMMSAKEAAEKAKKLEELENLFRSKEEIRKATTPVKDTIRAVNKVMTPEAKSLPGAIGRVGLETLGRAFAGGSAAYQGVDALNRLKRGDYAGAALGGLGAVGSAAALVPIPATRVVGTALGTLGGLGTTALDEYRKRKEPKMADGGPVQHYWGGGQVVSLSSPITAGAAPTNDLTMSATPSMATEMMAPTAFSESAPMQVANQMAPTNFGVDDRMMATNVGAGNPMMPTNFGAENPMMPTNFGADDQMMTTNVGVGSPMAQNNVMPKIRQFSPQRQPQLSPRRTQGGGVPAYMQNNRAYEAQRQMRGPFTAFPPANQLLPQGRVTPRRGPPVARMAEGGPVKKK